MRTPERRPSVTTADLASRPDDRRRVELEERRRRDGAPAPAEPLMPARTEDPRADAARDDVARMEAEGGPPPETARARDGERTPLLPHAELDELRTRWSGIQGRFVDEPQAAVEAADALVASAIQRIAQSFADERANLERQWGRSGDGQVSTEDLRQALRRYRSFFDRLLSI